VCRVILEPLAFVALLAIVAWLVDGPDVARWI
jgi:hypothetical protein